MNIVQIKTFTPDTEYRCEDNLPFGSTVVTVSVEDKINKFLMDNKVSIVNDIKFDTYQGQLEATIIYQVPFNQQHTTSQIGQGKE